MTFGHQGGGWMNADQRGGHTPTFECDDCHQRKPKIEETYEGSNYCQSCDSRPSPLATLPADQPPSTGVAS